LAETGGGKASVIGSGQTRVRAMLAGSALIGAYPTRQWLQQSW